MISLTRTANPPNRDCNQLAKNRKEVIHKGEVVVVELLRDKDNIWEVHAVKRNTPGLGRIRCYLDPLHPNQQPSDEQICTAFGAQEVHFARLTCWEDGFGRKNKSYQFRGTTVEGVILPST